MPAPGHEVRAGCRNGSWPTEQQLIFAGSERRRAEQHLADRLERAYSSSLPPDGANPIGENGLLGIAMRVEDGGQARNPDGPNQRDQAGRDDPPAILSN